MSDVRFRSGRAIVRVLGCALLACASVAHGQSPAQPSGSYPTRTVRIVAAEPAGASDFTARLIAQGLAGPLGQQVIVENRGGAGGLIAGDAVAKAPADGYTLLLHGSAIWLAPFLRDTTPYDPVRDFVPITLAVTATNVVAIHPSLPVKSVKELIALAKAKPGELNYGSGSVGSGAHLSAELFNAMANVRIVRIPYKGTGQAINALIGGQLQVMYSVAGSVMAHVKSGRLRAIAVTSAQPSALVPGLPTVAASGLPGYESASIYGVLAPAKTPDAVTARLNQEIVRVINRADIKEKFLSVGTETVGSTSEQFALAIKSEMTRLGKLIKDVGIRDE